MIRIEVALNQLWMSWCAVINCTGVHKDYQIHATGHPLDNLPFKMENLQEFSISYSQEQNMFIAILLSFFMIYFANFIYSELPNSGRGIFRALLNI